MKLNWAERWVVNNPFRVMEQRQQLAWMERVSGQVPFRPKRLLEVGAGRGAAARLLMDRFKPDLLLTTDLDPAMLNRARKYLSPDELWQANICAADCVALPFRDNVVDGVFGFGVIHHVIEWRKAISEIARVLRPGGVYFLEELYPGLYQNFFTKRILLHPASDRFRSNDLKTALTQSGLVITAFRELKSIGIIALIRKEG